jgi:hypothetical protein
VGKENIFSSMNAQRKFNREMEASFWYRRLLNLYPGAFREHYAAEMLRVFEEDWSRVRREGAFARWRYWVHVLCDLAGTMLREWLAAMPIPTKAGFIGIGVLLSLFAVGHEWLAIADWLFLCVFATVCWAVLIRPLRLGIASLLSAGVCGCAGFGIAKLLVRIVDSGPSEHGLVATAFVVQMLVMLVVYIGSERLHAPRVLFWLDQPGAIKLIFRHILFGLCFSTAWMAPLFFGFAAVSQTLPGMLLFLPCQFLARQLLAIWRNSDNVRKLDSHTQPA